MRDVKEISLCVRFHFLLLSEVKRTHGGGRVPSLHAQLPPGGVQGWRACPTPSRVVAPPVGRHQLHPQGSSTHLLTYFGQVAHVDVCGVLNRGHVFLNMSLTETFCIALLEAASCGLLVVSTCVGGVPEVLPPEMLVLAEPNPAGLLEAVAKALGGCPHCATSTAPFHPARSPRDSLRCWSLWMAFVPPVETEVVSSLSSQRMGRNLLD